MCKCAIPLANYNIWNCKFNNNNTCVHIQCFNMQYHKQPQLQLLIKQTNMTCGSTAVFEFAIQHNKLVYPQQFLNCNTLCKLQQFVLQNQHKPTVVESAIQFANYNMWYCKYQNSKMCVHRSFWICHTMYGKFQQTNVCVHISFWICNTISQLQNMALQIQTKQTWASTPVFECALPFANYHIWYGILFLMQDKRVCVCVWMRYDIWPLQYVELQIQKHWHYVSTSVCEFAVRFAN